MNTYMESLRHKVGYISLKMRHMEFQARNFPSLQGTSQPAYSRVVYTDLLLPGIAYILVFWQNKIDRKKIKFKSGQEP